MNDAAQNLSHPHRFDGVTGGGFQPNCQRHQHQFSPTRQLMRLTVSAFLDR